MSVIFPLGERYSALLSDALVAITLASFCCLPLWDLVTGGNPRLFLLDDSIGPSIFVPVLILTSLIAIIAMTALCSHRRNGSKLGSFIWILLVLSSFFVLCREFLFSAFARKIIMAIDSRNYIKIFITSCWMSAPILLMVTFGLSKWIALSKKLFIIMCPLPFIISVMTARTLLINKPVRSNQSVISLGSNNPVWVLIFDELDGQIALTTQVIDGNPSEFELWKSISINCTNAYPPAGDTLHSIPALIHGLPFGNTPTDLEYEFSIRTVRSTEKAAQWDWNDSLFSDIRRSGGTSAIIGTYFPYTIFYRNWVETLHWISPKAGIDLYSPEVKLLQPSIFLTLIKETLWGPLIYFMLDETSRSKIHAQALKTMNAHVERLVNSTIPDLTWIHYPIPHAPAIMGRSGSYMENLKIVNIELLKFRMLLEKRGCFNNSTIIITGDHWLRKQFIGTDFTRGLEKRWDTKDHRIPLFIKLPNQIHGEINPDGFNSIILRKLISVIRNGEISTPNELREWIIINTPYSESPLTQSSP